MKILKRTKKSWEPFRSCLINSTTNPAQLGWKWAGLAVQVTSKWLPRFFSHFQNIFLNDYIKNPQTRNANILAVGSLPSEADENTCRPPFSTCSTSRKGMTKLTRPTTWEEKQAKL